MNNTARSIKISILVSALVLGLAQFFINIQPQAAPEVTLPAPRFAAVTCSWDFCSINPMALVSGLDHPNQLTFDRDGVTLYLYDASGKPTGDVAVFTQKGAVVPSSAMTSMDHPCAWSCPGTCKVHEDDDSQEYCHITFKK